LTEVLIEKKVSQLQQLSIYGSVAGTLPTAETAVTYKNPWDRLTGVI